MRLPKYLADFLATITTESVRACHTSRVHTILVCGTRGRGCTGLDFAAIGKIRAEISTPTSAAAGSARGASHTETTRYAGCQVVRVVQRHASCQASISTVDSTCTSYPGPLRRTAQWIPRSRKRLRPPSCRSIPDGMLRGSARCPSRQKIPAHPPYPPCPRRACTSKEPVTTT